jgi:hypothetical protein
MKVNIAEANIRSIPITENLKRFFTNASVPPTKPNVDETNAKLRINKNPIELDESKP